MIHVDFDPSLLEGEDKDWWEKWQERADRAAKKAIKAWESSCDPSQIKPTPTIWSDLNKWLRVRIFHNKCAYCETSSPRYWADADHYRPKGDVGVASPGAAKWTPVQVTDHTGKPIPHPGYFWLAYDWRNLIPACKKCNSGLETPGKLCQFPVKQQHLFLTRLTPEEKSSKKEEPYESGLAPDLYYLRTPDLDDEERPLLLHPYRDRPEQHLSFEHGGVVLGTSPEGECTIEVCDLKHEELRIARQGAQESGAQTWAISYLVLLGVHVSPSVAWEQAWDALDDVKKGKAAYSAAVAAFIKSAYPPPAATAPETD